MSKSRSFKHWVAVGLILLLAVAACDLSSSPPASIVASPSDDACTPEEVADGGISGRVVDEEGNPLSDILILMTTAGFQGDVRTGENGVFSAPGVSGDFEISTTDIDYRDAVRRVTVPCGELVEVELVLTPVEP
jgi:hypothetical protein